MNVLVNGVTLNVNNAYTEREDDITLFVLVPQSEMDYAGLKELFKKNAKEIMTNNGIRIIGKIINGPYSL